MSQYTPDGRAIAAALGKLTTQVKRIADSRQHDFALTPAAPNEPDQEATEATEPAFIKAIDAVIRLQGPTITVHDDEITIEGLRIEHPARLTVHAGRRRLNLRHNAFLGDMRGALDVCRYVTCDCHQVATEAAQLETTARAFAGLHQSAEQDVSRVINLYEQWVKAGPPPLGASMARWWDARLVELHEAISPTTDQPKES